MTNDSTSAPLSAKKLRMKAGKTMVAKSAAGHRKFLQRIGQRVHYGRKLFQPRFCLIYSAGIVRHRSLFADLIFWFFCIKTKELGLRAHERLHAIRKQVLPLMNH
jgi:hypothetical protein